MTPSTTIRELRAFLLAMPRVAKRFFVLMLDVSLCLLSVWIAFYLRLGEFVSLTRPEQLSSGVLHATLVSIVLATPIFMASGLYRTIFRYSGWPTLLTIGKATALYALIYISIFTVNGVADVPRTIGIIQPILLLLFVCASRAVAHVWLGWEHQRAIRHADRPRVLIYGAGQSGRQLATAMSNNHEMRVVGFLDDDDRLHGHVIGGLCIYSPQELFKLINKLKVSDVLLAMPGISRHRRNQILSQMQAAQVAVRTLPSVTQLAQGRVSISDLRDLDIYDLLGREPVLPNDTLLGKNILGKVVLVTGAGGSIGSELCRQIMTVRPSKLLLIEQSEFALYGIQQDLASKFPTTSTSIIPLLASVQDKERMHQIMSTWKPVTVYHAAAYKHVPLVEHNPAEGIKNNVFGTLCTAQVALDNGASDFVLVSTDKAVRPTNIMGASKRLAELVLQALAKESIQTKFTMVRFGNVLGSSGSVVPKFRQQIRDGGPITLTHPDITRFFMTTQEAAQLVIQAAAMAEGGDVFVLDMGEPVRIADLAKRMVELSGLTIKNDECPLGDIEIHVTGLRPGEKLYEELLTGDNPEKTSHPRIMRAKESCLAWEYLEAKLSSLEWALKVNDVNAIRSMMLELARGYAPTTRIVDWVFSEQEARKLRLSGAITT